MLNSHPAIAVPDETKIFEAFVPLLPLYGDLRQAALLRRLVSDVLAWRWVRRLPSVPDVEAILRSVERPTLGGVFEALLSLWARGQGKARWGEKTPNHLYFWPFIEAAFPQARVVHIVRDGRDVALSQVKAPFGPKTIATAAERWVRFVECIHAIGLSIGPGRYLEARYEDLLAWPRETITRILQLIGEPYDPMVLQFHVDAATAGTDSVNDANIRKPLLVGNTGKWQDGLSRRQLIVFEAIGGQALDVYGYARATAAKPMRGFERAFYRYVHQLPIKALYMARNRAGIAERLELERIRWRLFAEQFGRQFATRTPR
jgi:hypothetical protein